MNIKKAWAGMNTDMHVPVHVHLQLRMRLQRPQFLAHWYVYPVCLRRPIWAFI